MSRKNIAQVTISDWNFSKMKNCASCKKQIIIKMITTMLDLKSKEIETRLHLSKSVVSRYMTGERGCEEIDLFFIEKIFNITVKDYMING